MFSRICSSVSGVVNHYTNTIFGDYQGTTAELYLAQRTYDVLGRLIYGVSRPAVSSRLIKTFVGNEQAIQQRLEALVPRLTTSEFSKMLRGFRYALTHILNDQAIPYDTMGKKWRVDVISVNDYFESLIHPKKSYALVDDNLPFWVIRLPKLKFPEAVLQQYFSDLNNDAIFTDLDNYHMPKPAWVIRIKKIWNLLFLVEKIFNAIERHSFDLASPENLADFNHAYNLLFDLDINVLDFFEKIHEKFSVELSKGMTNQIFQALFQDKLWLAKNLGFYLGLTLSQLGSTGNIFSFANQTKEVLPHIFAEITLMLQKIVTAITTQSRVSVDSEHARELQREAAKIVQDINQFLKLQEDKTENFLDIFLSILDFMAKPDRQKIFKLFKYLAQEHRTLSVEFIRLIKYEVFPALIGFFEEFENSLMLEPGSIVFYIENYSQMFYESMTSSLGSETELDMQSLYSPNWIMVREYQGLKRLSILEQLKTKLRFELSILDTDGERLERFKVLYPYFVKVDSFATEQIRARFSYDIKAWSGQLVSKTQGFSETLWTQSIEKNWDQLVPKVKALILSQLLQVENQIQLLKDYIKSFNAAKKRQVCYFEIMLDKRLSFDDLPQDTKDRINRINADEQEGEIQRALIGARFEKLNAWLDTDEPQRLFKAEEALIKCEDEYFLVQKNQEQGEQLGFRVYHLTNLALPFNPSHQKSVFLPGKVLESLAHDLNHYALILSDETSRYSLKLDKDYIPKYENFSLEQLNSDELYQYSIAWREKNIKIQRARDMLAKMILLIHSSQRTHLAINQLKYYYFNLQGVFQYFLSPQAGQAATNDRFLPFNRQFIAHLFETPGLLETCQEITGALEREFHHSETQMSMITTRYQAQYKIEKRAQFQLDKKDPRAGYLLRSKKYSTFFRDKINELYTLIETHGSSDLKRMLIQHQKVQSAMYDKRYPFPESDWEQLPKNIVEICYLHNALFYLEKLFWRFERQQRYDLTDSKASYELVSRIYSIIDFFRFYNFVYYHHYSGAIVQSTQQFLRFEPVVQFAQRYSQIYDLRDVDEFAYLSGPVSSKQMMMDIFTDASISQFLLQGKTDSVILDKVTALMTQQVLIEQQFSSLERHPIFLAHFNELERFKNKLAIRKSDLNQLKEQILTSDLSHERLIWKKASYAIRNQFVDELALTYRQLEANDDLLKKRYKLILRLIEKSQQGLTKELKFEEKILLKLMSGQTLNAKENQYVANQVALQTQFNQAQTEMGQYYQTLLIKQSQVKLNKTSWDNLMSIVFKAQLQNLSQIASEEQTERIISEIAQNALNGVFNVDVRLNHHLSAILAKQPETRSLAEQLLMSLIYQRDGRFYCYSIRFLEQVNGQTLMQQLLIKVASFKNQVHDFNLSEAEQNLLDTIFQKSVAELNAEETVLKRIFQQDEGQYRLRQYPDGLTPGENLFKKIVTRKRLGLSFELNQAEKLLLKNRGVSQPIFEKLLEGSDLTWTLRRNPIDFLNQFLLELSQTPIRYPFKPVNELTYAEILALPQVQLMLMRSDIYQAYLNHSRQPTEASQMVLNTKLKQAFSQVLQELRVMEWRHQKLRNIHLHAKKMIGQYELIQKGKNGFMARHLIGFSSALASCLREVIVCLKDNMELNISSLKDELLTPFITEFEALEIKMGLKPGFFTAFLEHQGDALIKEFAGQISSSPVHCPLILANRLNSLRKRKANIEGMPNSQSHHLYLDNQIQDSINSTRQRQEKVIIDGFIEKARVFCTLLEGQYQFISNASLKDKKILYRYLENHLWQNILEPWQMSYRLKIDIFTAIISQESILFGQSSPQDAVFNQKIIPILSTFMQGQKHHFKKLDDLMNSLDAYEAYLAEVEKTFNQISQRLDNSNLTWYQRLMIHIEYLFKIRIYYASLTLTLIQQKQAALSQLKTHLMQNCEAQVLIPMDQVLNSFAQVFSNPVLEDTLKASASIGWYPGKLIFQFLAFILKCIIWILNCILPRSLQIRFMEPPHLQHHEDIKYILKQTQKDVSFDFQKPLDKIIGQDLSVGIRMQLRAN